VVVGSQIGFQLGSPANPGHQWNPAYGITCFLGASMRYAVDLAGQRLTSGMVHGPEFGLTPRNAREALGAVVIPKAM
jgi:hypothetical protein